MASDYEVYCSWEEDCPECGETHEVSGVVDERYGGEIMVVCQNCGVAFVSGIEFNDALEGERDDYRDRFSK